MKKRKNSGVVVMRKILSELKQRIDDAKLMKRIKERGKKLFSGIISLAHYLNLSVVCEGVETEEQNALVTESACDYIQGWYYCKAMPENKALEFALAYMQGEPA